MNVSSKKTDELNQVLTVEIAAADYDAALRKKLNELQKQAEAPGFRKGKVPFSLIERWYGERVLGEAVNKAVGEALNNYISDNKLNIIGEPLPSETDRTYEWKAGNDFSFDFDIALTPAVNLTLDKKDEVPSYTINITETEKKKFVDSYKKQMEAVAKSAKEEGREAPEAKSDEDILAEVTSRLDEDYKNAAKYRLDRDIRDYCVKKAAIEVPEAFLRRFLKATNENKLTDEQIDKEFDKFLEDYRWQLVMTELTKQFDVKVEDSDINEEARNFAKYQYAMYGMTEIPDDVLDGLVQNLLKDESSVSRMVENIQTRKVIDGVKERITIKAKKISAEKFRAL